MKLVIINIINNQRITGTKNPLQFIDRAEIAMFLDYNDNLDGAIYLIREYHLASIERDLKHNNLEYTVLSKHKMNKAIC